MNQQPAGSFRYNRHTLYRALSCPLFTNNRDSLFANLNLGAESLSGFLLYSFAFAVETAILTFTPTRRLAFCFIVQSDYIFINFFCFR